MLSLLMPTRKAAAGVRSQNDYFESLPRRTVAGVHVNEQTALTFSTVFLCQRILSEAIACMPISQYERTDDGDRKTIRPQDSPALEALAFPNDEMTGIAFRDSRTGHQINHYGGGFAEIERTKGGGLQFHPIAPNRVSPGRDGYDYQVLNDDGRGIGMYRDEMLHIVGAIPDDGIWSKGIVHWARETFGGALAVDTHCWAYFGSGAQPKGLLINPALKNREDRREWRKEHSQFHGDPRSSEIMIITNKDASYSPIHVSNVDNQFNESRVFNRKVVCEWYRVPVYMIGERTPTGNIEAQAVDFIMYSLSPWAIKWEQELNRKLLPRDKRLAQYFEHDFSSLLRGDIKTRMDAYRLGLMSGAYKINQILRLENLPSIGPAGNVTYVPANMVTAEYMAEHGNGAAPVGSGSARGPGSDHSGAPGDNPNDHEPRMSVDRERVFADWMGKLPKMMADEIASQMSALEDRLEHRKVDYRELARLQLTETLEWLLAKEAGEAQRAFKRNGDLEAWLREFYSKHELFAAEKLRSACMSLRLAGVVKWSDRLELAAWLRARSTEELRRIYNQDSKEVAEKKLAAWPEERTGRIVGEVMG